MPTYNPGKTPHRDAAKRCGLALEKRGSINCALINTSGATVYEGSREGSWEWMKHNCGLVAAITPDCPKCGGESYDVDTKSADGSITWTSTHCHNCDHETDAARPSRLASHLAFESLALKEA